MKTSTLRFCLALSLAFLAPGASSGAAAAAPSTIEAELEAMWTAWRAQEPTGADRATRAYWEHTDKKFQAFVQAARALAAKYPTDPRRYAPLIQSSYTAPYFIKGFKPEFDTAPGPNNAIIDTEAKMAHLRTQIGFLSEIVAAADADPRQRGGAFNALLVDSRILAGLTNQSFDPAALAPVVDRVLANLPDERALPVVEQFAGALRRDSAGAAQAFQAKVDAIPALAAAMKAANEKRAKAAAAKAKAMEQLSSLKFTAADGREVDLTKLRGKVVLIDFWATWCGPCVKEIPTVVAAYEKYHAKGFEVIGITLENASLKADDTPEQTAAKLAAAKKKMQDYTAAKNMPWPQHYDGQYWKNEFAVKFGIQSIPAMFLLDQEGRIASTVARGEALDREVRRLLKL
jgi:thiol-disulfide isomerase/thioredoxin